MGNPQLKREIRKNERIEISICRKRIGAIFEVREKKRRRKTITETNEKNSICTKKCENFTNEILTDFFSFSSFFAFSFVSFDMLKLKKKMPLKIHIVQHI